MTAKELLEAGGGALFLALTLLQIAPIKINPWSTIARSLGRALNKDVMDKMDEGAALSARYRIVRFNDEIRHDVWHSEEHFNQIIEDIDIYERYCKGHPTFPNGKAVHSVANIRKVYEKCVEEDSFL